MSRHTPRPARALALVAALALITSTLAAHDLFLKLDTYSLPENTDVRVPVLNGTFRMSESVVARERVGALTLVGLRGSTALDTTALTARNDTSFISLRTGGSGTYVLGLSVLPRTVDYTGEQLNEYLKAEGYEDVLAERTRNGTLGQSGRRRYATHVKAVFQVGQTGSIAFSAILGHAAEIVPLDNPYDLERGATLRLRCLLDGQPVAGLVVRAGGLNSKGGTIAEAAVQTDRNGVARVPITTAGRWYVKFAKMRPFAGPDINYESQRATLTFEVR